MAQSLRGPLFISYSRKDEEVLRRIANFLHGEGFQLWVSPASKDSEWVRREISLADHYHKRIFPLLVRGDGDTAITLRLITRQFVDIRTKEKLGLKSLCTALSKHLESLSTEEE